MQTYLLTGNTLEIIKAKAGLFNQEAVVQIKQVGSNKASVYVLSMIPKAVTVYDDVIGVNMGTEVDFIGTNGWLIKKYTSSRNIKDIVVCNNIAGIIYKDKIELIGL